MQRGRRYALGVLLLAVAACSDAVPPPVPTPTPTPSTVAQPTQPNEPGVRVTESAGTVVRVRVQRRTQDAATSGFARTVMAVLNDPRGWPRGDVAFVRDATARYRIVLAEGPVVDRLCLPYDTEGRYSCQNGPTVALNADRWRGATPSWPLDLQAYRVMLVNHEVGHLLHLHHPQPQCPGRGLPAPVMTQQSTTLDDCDANPWPLAWEIDLLRQRAEPFAPPARHDPSDHRPSPPPEGGG